jgi:ribonucleoside-triphosphate reductase
MQLVAVAFQLQSLNQFGGVSATHLDWTMVPFVRKSFSKHFKDGLKQFKSKWKIEVPKQLSFEDKEFNRRKYRKIYKYAMAMTEKECHQAIEAMYHNLNTLQSRSGNQLPFTSINFGLCTEPEGRLISKYLLQVCREGLGKFHKTSIFPCVIFQCKKGVNRKPGEPNYDLFKMALQCTSERLYPNYANADWTNQQAWVNYDRQIKEEVIGDLSFAELDILREKLEDSVELQLILGLDPNLNVRMEETPLEVFSTMGCRTANGADVNFKDLYEKNIHSVIENGSLVCDTLLSAVQKDGRGNIAPTTIILPTLAMEAEGNVDRFFRLLKKKLDEAKDSLIDRFNWICAQSPDSAKFMYENHTMAGYIPEEGIRSALKHGTLAIGMLGLAETLEILVGCNHAKPEGMSLAKQICGLYKSKCEKYKKEYSLNFGVYYTPAENLCYTAMKKFQSIYGIIPKVSDHEFFTNSMHIPVWEEIDAFNKIKLESELTGYSSAGCITYVELDSSVKNNIGAMESLVNYAMDYDIPYFAINVPVDLCKTCGHQGDFNGKECPECGSTDIQCLRRVTGYLTGSYLDAFNYGKQKEVESRVKHTGVEISP